MHSTGEHAVSHQFHQQATSSPVRVGFCTASKLVDHVSKEHKCPGPVMVPFRFLDHSLTTFGRWVCGERCHHKRN
ncbi:TPA: hypothetical protein JTK81_004840 [Escherichia coli]|uniref:hypothetical protein n=1 Tax=Escherichia coli TaxID=562 RepID=UPI0011E7E57F|nr:hypothetical protein [Escherichia coli]EED0594984.1 hypothetical protein [Escherichia coli]EER7696489.1 hypothetical protein [Escherichia coli]EEV6409031.1 hypothetical protein [Escherichia coli]EEZ6520347.1 hypothetical protein [Escherichia coli]EFA7328015.1 hypothetical protein [Escherichia coli]